MLTVTTLTSYDRPRLSSSVDYCLSSLQRDGPSFMKLRIVKKKAWYWEWSYVIVAGGLFFRLPYLYRSRLGTLCDSHHRNLIDRWDGFLPSLVNEWNRLNVVVSVWMD